MQTVHQFEWLLDVFIAKVAGAWQRIAYLLPFLPRFIDGNEVSRNLYLSSFVDYVIIEIELGIPVFFQNRLILFYDLVQHFLYFDQTLCLV